MRCAAAEPSRAAAAVRARAPHTPTPNPTKNKQTNAHTHKKTRATDIGAAPAAPKLAAGLAYAPTVRDMFTCWNYVSGWLLVLLAAAAYPFALSWPRKAKWCKRTAAGRLLNQQGAFWCTHHMLILVYIPVLVLHSISFTPGVRNSAARALGINKMLWYLGA